MLQDAHSRKVKVPLTVAPGDTVLVDRLAIAGTLSCWVYIHEIIGDLSVTGTVIVVGINADASEQIMASFALDAGQGLTVGDEPGEDNRPRFEFKPGQTPVLRVTGGTFNGALDYSIRY